MRGGRDEARRRDDVPMCSRPEVRRRRHRVSSRPKGCAGASPASAEPTAASPPPVSPPAMSHSGSVTPPPASVASGTVSSESAYIASGRPSGAGAKGRTSPSPSCTRGGWECEAKDEDPLHSARSSCMFSQAPPCPRSTAGDAPHLRARGPASKPLEAPSEEQALRKRARRCEHTHRRQAGAVRLPLRSAACPAHWADGRSFSSPRPSHDHRRCHRCRALAEACKNLSPLASTRQDDPSVPKRQHQKTLAARALAPTSGGKRSSGGCWRRCGPPCPTS